MQGEIADLRASRRRLVSAADADRRAIEGALHDGVQQHLIALAVDLRRLAGLVDADPVAARPLLDEMTATVRTAIAEATELAERIYPPLLAVRGFATAHQISGRAPWGHRPGRRAGRCRLPARDLDCHVLVVRRDAVVRVRRVGGNGQRARRWWHAELRSRDRRTSPGNASTACAIASRRSMAAWRSTSGPTAVRVFMAGYPGPDSLDRSRRGTG